MEHVYVPDLGAEVTIPDEGTLSRTVHRDGLVRLVVFGFDEGQELSEHTSASAAVVQVVSGSITVEVEGVERRMDPAAWLLLPPGLAHSLRALEPSVVLLTLVRPSGG
jgi:quercetin dioxygenase-like cupin family protein